MCVCSLFLRLRGGGDNDKPSSSTRSNTVAEPAPTPKKRGRPPKADSEKKSNGKDHRARESLPARTTPVLALTQRACHTFHSAACAGDVFHSALNMKEGPLRRQHQLGHPRRFRRCCYLPQPHTDAAAEQKNRATWQMQGTGRGRRGPNLVGGWKRARGHARGRRCGGPGRMGGACRVAHLNESREWRN